MVSAQNYVFLFLTYVIICCLSEIGEKCDFFSSLKNCFVYFMVACCIFINREYSFFLIMMEFSGRPT